ncbi:MAG: hypothetical protein Q7R50_01780, partial [Dehalococcoidales bacterium]|nr:hypothetical protein [Dehalococcoidales bacterium]
CSFLLWCFNRCHGSFRFIQANGGPDDDCTVNQTSCRVKQGVSGQISSNRVPIYGLTQMLLLNSQFQTLPGKGTKMKMNLAMSFSAVLLFSFTGCGYSNAELTLARQEGYENGRTIGVNEGRQAGYTDGRKAGYDEGYKAGLYAGNQTGFNEGRATVNFTGKPVVIGPLSVLEKNAILTTDKMGNYTTLQISAKVQNLGEDGVLTVFSEVTPKDSVMEGKNNQSIQVFLTKGEEKQLYFRFWIISDATVKYYVGDPPPVFSR